MLYTVVMVLFNTSTVAVTKHLHMLYTLHFCQGISCSYQASAHTLHLCTRSIRRTCRCSYQASAHALHLAAVDQRGSGGCSYQASAHALHLSYTQPQIVKEVTTNMWIKN